MPVQRSVISRLLITGSRDWTDWGVIRSALQERFYPEKILVTGAARGADAIAEAVWRGYGGRVERHPADWSTYKRAAGHIRNKKMVDLGADECLAFIKNASPGATGCAALAEKAGIRTTRWEAG